MRNSKRIAVSGLGMALVIGSALPPLLAQEGKSRADIRAELEKEFEAARKGLLEKVSRILSQQDERLASLEKALKEKDREIAELRKKLEEKPSPKAQGFLGVAHDEPEAAEVERARQYLKEGRGAKVTQVAAESPAARAGIQQGDIILSVAGKEASSPKLSGLIQGFGAGEKVDVVFLRGSEKLARTVELADREKFLASTESRPAPKPSEAPPPPPAPAPVFLGLTVQEDDGGVLTVKKVEPKKTGAVAQIREEDIILSLNQKAVKRLEELTEIRDKAKVGEELTIEYKRKDEVLRAVVIAADEKGEAKLVKVEKVAGAKPAEGEKKPDLPGRGPATLGVEVVEDDGVLRVLEVKPGGAAAEAGIQKDDIIRQIGGQRVTTPEELKALLKARSPGDVVSLTIARGAEQKVIEKVKLGGAAEVAAAKPPLDKPAPKPDEPKPAPPKKPRGVLGITAEERDDNRLVILVVKSKGPGDKAGLKKDDVLLKVNGVEIKNFDDLEQVLKERQPGDTLKVVVKRGDETKEVDLVLGSPETEPQARAEPRSEPEPIAAGASLGVAFLQESVLGEVAALSPITVEEVLSGSPAERAGLRVGDEVLGVGDLSVRSLLDVARALEGRSPGEAVRFTISRSGRALETGLILKEGSGR